MKHSTQCFIVALILFIVASIWTTTLAFIIIEYKIPYPSMPVFMMCIPPLGLYVATFFTLMYSADNPY